MMQHKSNIPPGLIILLLTASFFPGYAQPSFKAQAVRISEDNDFINLRGEGTDRYYTNGTRIDLLYTKSPARKFPTSLLIPLHEGSDDLYAVGINQLIFTPSDISNPQVIVGDRPYAGLLFLNHTLVSSDNVNNQKLTTEMDLGVIGPASFARETQTFIHRLIHSQKPMGWDNQVKDDIILNYQIQYEKLLISPSDKFELIGLVEADAGTLSNKIAAGLTFRVGRYNSYFSHYEKPGIPIRDGAANSYMKYQFYFYLKPVLVAFMDNSVLQGGMFTGYHSVYTIPTDSLTRYYMQFEYGIVFGIKRFGISVDEKLRTRAYTGSQVVQVGNITLFIGL